MTGVECAEDACQIILRREMRTVMMQHCMTSGTCTHGTTVLQHVACGSARTALVCCTANVAKLDINRVLHMPTPTLGLIAVMYDTFFTWWSTSLRRSYQPPYAIW